MTIELSQQEAAMLLNFLAEFDLTANTAEGRLILDIVDKIKPVATNELPQA